MDSISTLLVSYHSLVIKGIVGHLKNKDVINLLEHASNKLEMMLRIQEHNPTIIIINDDHNNSGDANTLEIIGQTLNEFPSIKMLLIVDNYDMDKELEALRTGIRGIITENFEQEELIDSILSISSGGLWFRKEVMEQFINEQLLLKKYSDKSLPTIPSFTKRELEIIQLVVSGQKNREIGNQLFISEKTVKHHLTKIFRKLNINKRVQLKGLI